MCQFPLVKWDRNLHLLLFCTIFKTTEPPIPMRPVCASLLQSKVYLFLCSESYVIGIGASHRLEQACRHVKILYSYLYSEVNDFFSCWGCRVFFKFILLRKINASVDFPAGEYKGSFCFSNRLWKARFRLNPKGKPLLQQDSQEPGRQTSPNLYPALSEVIVKK